MSSRSSQIPSADRPADRGVEGAPLAPTSGADLLETGHDSMAFLVSNDASGVRPNNRLGTLGTRRLSHLVNERDLAILESVRQHRLIHTGHLYELHFWNHASYASGIRACTRVLARLEGHRFIRRVARTQGGHGGGSAPTVWALDVAGDRLLRRSAGDSGRSRVFQPSVAFLEHTLAIADARTTIERAARDGHFELLAVQTEPETWRTYPGEVSTAQSIKPDLYLVTASTEYEDHWFIEIDMGTESSTTLRRKLDAYQRYRASGREQQLIGVFPRVLWVVPDARRATILERLLGDTERSLFSTTTATSLLAALVAAESAPTSDVSSRTSDGGGEA